MNPLSVKENDQLRWNKIKNAFHDKLQTQAHQSLREHLSEQALALPHFLEGLGEGSLTLLELGVSPQENAVKNLYELARNPKEFIQKQETQAQQGRGALQNPRRTLRYISESIKDELTQKTIDLFLSNSATQARSWGELAPGLAFSAAGKIAQMGEALPSLGELREATQVLDKGGELTRAGRALQKHGNRIPTAFPRPTGNPQTLNQMGKKIVEEIFGSSDIKITTTYKKRFDGKVIEVRLSNGKGLQFNQQGKFIGFLEPWKKNLK